MNKKFTLGDGSALKTPALKKQLNSEMFSIIAPKYDWITRIFSFNQDKKWKRQLVARLEPERVQLAVDLACGTGDICRSIAAFSDHVVAVDICAHMLQLAQTKQQRDNVFYVMADMQHLPLANHSVDWITGGYALRNAPDLAVLLKTIYLKLKPGGKALFLDFSKPADAQKAAIQTKLLKFWTSLWGMVFHGNPDVYNYIPASLALFPNTEELKSLVLSLGFTDFYFQEYFGGFTGMIEFRKPLLA